jgi:hypothetical protein
VMRHATGQKDKDKKMHWVKIGETEMWKHACSFQFPAMVCLLKFIASVMCKLPWKIFGFIRSCLFLILFCYRYNTDAFCYISVQVLFLPCSFRTTMYLEASMLFFCFVQRHVIRQSMYVLFLGENWCIYMGCNWRIFRGKLMYQYILLWKINGLILSCMLK